MSLTQPPHDFPPEGFTLYEDILDAEEVFDDGTYEPEKWLRFEGCNAEVTITIDDITPEMVRRFFGLSEDDV